MARQKLSEFRAKTMLARTLDTSYAGLSIDASESVGPQLVELTDSGSYVVKVDQAIKKRFKQGLVRLERSRDQVETDITELASQGYRYFLVEPFQAHDQANEKYLSLSFSRAGVDIAYSSQGGIDIESAADSVLHASDQQTDHVASALGVDDGFLQTLLSVFAEASCTSLEINPLVVTAGQMPQLLDVAAEVDGEAAHISRKYWQPSDIRSYKKLSGPELKIAELASISRASLRFETINPDGAIFVLLSGGGASIVVADEVNNLGFGKQLANYGEYSGNPSAVETQGYTSALLDALLASQARQKVLIIAGAVANFTDVRATFAGVIAAINSVGDQLREQGVKVFVRRGGPHQKAGLAMMESCLAHHDLLGSVHGPEQPIAEVVRIAVNALQQDQEQYS